MTRFGHGRFPQIRIGWVGEPDRDVLMMVCRNNIAADHSRALRIVFFDESACLASIGEELNAKDAKNREERKGVSHLHRANT